MKALSARAHGVIDYVAVVFFAIAPFLFGFGGTPMIVSFVLAGLHLLLTLFTAFPLGAVKAIPFTVHGGVEGLIAPSLVLLPWVLRFSDVLAARWFFVAAGVALGLTWFTTDYEAIERAQETRFHRRPSHAS
jgi:hypothetical protein